MDRINRTQTFLALSLAFVRVDQTKTIERNNRLDLAQYPTHKFQFQSHYKREEQRRTWQKIIIIS